MELKKESMSLSQMRMNDSSQILVEGDVIVPDVKPDIANILQADASAVITNREKSEDKIHITGTIFLKILYIPEGAEGNASAVKSINTKFDFTDDLPSGGQDDAFLRVNALADQVECTLIHSRKMNFKVLVTLDCKTYAQREVEFVTGMDDADMELRRTPVNLYNMKLIKPVEFVVEENLDVPGGKPDIGELLKMDVKVRKDECKLMNNKAMLKGNLNLCTLYTGDMEGQGIEFMEHELPFSEVIDLEGLDEGDILDVSYEVKDVYYAAKEDMNGDPRILGVEVLLVCTVCVSETKRMEIVSDCYTPKGNTRLEMQKVQMEELLCDDTTQTTLKQLIAIPADRPSVDGVYNVIAHPCILDKYVEGGSLIVEGTAAVNILYVSSSGSAPVCSYREDIPFRQAIPIEGITADMACDVTVSMEHTSFSLSMASEVEVRCILEFNTKVIRSYPMDIITACEVEACEETRQMPSLIIYFAQPNDCMWDIAKRYKTTIDKIKTANKLEDDFQLCAGQKIMIPSR